MFDLDRDLRDDERPSLSGIALGILMFGSLGGVVFFASQKNYPVMVLAGLCFVGLAIPWQSLIKWLKACRR